MKLEGLVSIKSVQKWCFCLKVDGQLWFSDSFSAGGCWEYPPPRFRRPKAVTLPRSTVAEALGSVNVACEFAVTTVAAGGLSGSG